jgi:Bacterial tandem repeat domain 1
MPNDKDDPSNWPVVISLHGIRTTGKWQKDLTDELVRQKFRYEPLDFGFFMALSLLIPWSRSKKVEWFHEKYSDFTGKNSEKPSLIAHSFGTYIAAKAMLKYSDIKFDKIILCGSIVSIDYPWTDMILNNEQVNSVLNEAGGQDIWSKLVGWVVEDAGPSGVNGFIDCASDKVIQLKLASHRHSDYFYSQNYRESWIPFLQGSNPKQIITPKKLQKNWRFYTTLTIIFLSLIYWYQMSDWLTQKQYDQVWEKKRKDGSYPTSVLGKCGSKTELFTAKWQELPHGTLFESWIVMSKSTYNEKQNALKNEGYKLDFESKFVDCAGVDRYQATWLKKQ